MSQCFTLTSAGLAKGMVVSDTVSEQHPFGILVDTDFVRHREDDDDSYIFGEDDSWLVRADTYVYLDRRHVPMITKGHRIHAASLVQGGQSQYLATPRRTDRGVLVHINTSYEDMQCQTGGSWEVLAGKPRIIAEGRDGYTTYSEYPMGRYGLHVPDPFGGVPREEVDRQSWYAVGLLLLMPGDRLKISFHAPGQVEGVLFFKPKGGLEFELTHESVDASYEYPYPGREEFEDHAYFERLYADLMADDD